MIKKTIIAIFIFSSVTTLFAQEFYKKDRLAVDTATFMVWASPNFSVQAPFGKGYLASAFKFNMSAGIDVTIKTQSNWTIDIAFNYMFGSKLRLTPKEIFGDMAIEILRNDTVIDYAYLNGAGNNSLTLKREGRYWYLGATVGKIFPVNRWKNSGLWLKLGAGYFGHKIHFTDPNSYFPQIDQEYRYGYDRRAQGLSLNQFFGYMFMQKRRTLSFYIGVEMWEIFTKLDRGYVFTGIWEGPTDNKPRMFSGLFGIKLGWILPFYETNRTTTYYYY